MAKRFGRLKYALKTLKTSRNFGDPDSPAPNAPANTVLADFQKSRKEDSYGNITRKASSKQEDLVEVTIQPFLKTAIEANRRSVKYSKRAQDRQTTYVGNALNLLTPNNGASERGFQPAKIIIHDFSATAIGSAADANKISQITGIKYNYKGGASFTFPFGRGSGTSLATFDEVKTAILTQATLNQPDRTANFKMERLPL
jgi:hypothetical protein